MTHYQDLKIFPDSEIDIAFLRNKIFQKLHKAIFDLGANDIGVSFPKADSKLGDTIRIHSDKAQLIKLAESNWLGGLSGYCEVNEVLPVPNNIKGYQTISRIRQNMSLLRMQKKIAYQQNKGYIKTEEDINTYKKNYKEKMFKSGLNNPYLELQSASTGNLYRLYIEFGDMQKQGTAGEFNRFGFSKVATVPIF